MVTTPYDPATLAYHELRAPLGLMLTAAQSAAQECDDATVRSRCEVIVRTADRMLRVAQELFRLSGLRASEPELYLPGRVVAQVVNDLSELGLPVAVVRDEVGTAVRATGSLVTFEALVSSLITNANDHARPGTTIEVSLTSENGYLRADIENQAEAADRHRGLGAGRFIEAQLAAELGAGMFSRDDSGRYTATILLPVADPLSE